MILERFITKITLKDFFSKKQDFFLKKRNGIIIVKNAINKDKVRKIVSKILKTKKNYVKKPLIVEGVKNICWTSNFKKIKKDQYSTKDKTWYFFPWNRDYTGIVKETKLLFKRIVEINGYDYNVIEKNTPKDKIIKRIQLIFYPYGTGLISTHRDPINVLKINSGIYVTEYKTDYNDGGFYLYKNKKKYFLDHHVKSGDLVLFHPNITHGVDPVSKLSLNSRNIFKGRCFLNMAIVQSHEVKNRVYTEGV